jgi:nucleotide-binding universal stress UspA family protein
MFCNDIWIGSHFFEKESKVTIKTILACLTSELTSNSVLSLSCTLARRHEAHLHVLRISESQGFYPAADMPIPESVYQEYESIQAAKTAALKSIFEKHTYAEDFVSEWREIKSEIYTPEDCIIESAGCADIVVMPALEADDERTIYVKLLERIIRYCGRPVLVAPASWQNKLIGESVLIGWNGSREAVRAAHDVLQLLQSGDEVTILNIQESNNGNELISSTGDLAAAFDRHGVNTTVSQRPWTASGVAEALNKEAFEIGADMIAVGAFGHSRIYQLLIGGATRNLLGHSKLPVMFSR